jgi:hypothetical protein
VLIDGAGRAERIAATGGDGPYSVVVIVTPD